MRWPSLRLLLLVFIFNAAANLSATSTLENDVEYDDNVDVEELKNLANQTCLINPTYKRAIWKCLRKPVFDKRCIRIAQECTKIDTDSTDTITVMEKDRLTSVVENVVSGLEEHEKNDIMEFTQVEFSYQERHPEFRREILAKCYKEGVQEQWIMKGTPKSFDEFCNDDSILPDKYLEDLRYEGKCKPYWLSLELRAAFYLECLERFDFDGLVTRVQSDVRSMKELAINYRKAELRSAERSVGVGASAIAGGIFTGIGIILAPFTAGGSLMLSGIGSAVVTGSSVASLFGNSGNDQVLISEAAKNSNHIKKDIGFLEELMTIYLASTNEGVPALTFNQEMIREELEDKVMTQIRSSTALTVSTGMAVDTIINAVKLKNTGKAVGKIPIQSKLTRSLTKTGRLYSQLTTGLASRVPLLSRIAKSQFGIRASKLLKAASKGARGLFKSIVPLIEIGFGIWEIVDGKKRMAPGGIHNQILLQSRQITHRIADLAATYTEFVGTQIDVNPNKFVSEELYEIDVYSPTEGVYLSLAIESNGTELCRTKKFQTGSQGHVFVHSSDILAKCAKHQIQDKTATIRLISYSNSRVQIDKVDIRTNGKFVPSISCTKKNGGTYINVQRWKLDNNKKLENKKGVWKSDDLWIFKPKDDDLIYIENTSKAKVLGTTSDGKVILEDFEEGKAHQLWKKGELDAEDHFTLENAGVPKVLTAISNSSFEIRDPKLYYKSVPLILTRSGVRSDPIDCKHEMALQRVKTHTTHISFSGTDANVYMTFRVTNVKENVEVGRCERLKLSDRCNSFNCHEYGAIENYYVSDLATCGELLGELAEGLWDSAKYELEVEMYNDGTGVAPDWSIDMLKLYFLGGSGAKIVSCYGGPDQGDAGDVWIEPFTTTILKCQLHQPKKPEISLEAINVHVCNLYHSGSWTDQLIFRFCENKNDLKGSPADVRNSKACCVTNRFGYYNMNNTINLADTSSSSSSFERNKWKSIDGNTKHDDGGDKLGLCEGFEIKGPKIFMSVENQDSDAVCIDQLKFYGTPKHAIQETPFGGCNLPAHTWAESHLVEKYAKNSNKRIAKMPGQQAYNHELAINECYLGEGSTLKSLDIMVCGDGVDVGSESEFTVIIRNGNNQECTMTIKEHLHKNTYNEIKDIPTEGGCGSGKIEGDPAFYNGLDLGNEVQMWILNANKNDTSDALCLTHTLLQTSNSNGDTGSLECRYNNRADFAIYFQGSEVNGLPLICS